MMGEDIGVGVSSGAIVGAFTVGVGSAGVSGMFWVGSAGDAVGMVDGVGTFGGSDAYWVIGAVGAGFCSFELGLCSGIIPFLRVFIFE